MIHEWLHPNLVHSSGSKGKEKGKEGGGREGRRKEECCRELGLGDEEGMCMCGKGTNAQLSHTHTHTHTHSPSSTVGTGPDGDVDGTEEGTTIFGVSPGTVLQRSPRQQHE